MNRKVINVTPFLVFALAFFMAVGAKGQMIIDPSESTVNFVIGNSGADVKGKLNGLNGEITFDETDLSSAKFEVNIPVKGLRSGNSMRDEHLFEAEFFDKANHPSITFISVGIEKKEGYYELTGDLGIKGFSKEVSIQFVYSENTFEGKLTVNRTDYNVGGADYSDSISENVDVTIRCVVKEK